MTVCFYFSLFLNENRFRQQQNQDITNDDVRTPLINSNNESTTTTTTLNLQQKNFFKSALLYQNALLYVFSRLFMTTALVYIPLWLDERSWTPITSSIYTIRNNNNTVISAATSTNSNIENIATMPLMSFLSSIIASIFMK